MSTSPILLQSCDFSLPAQAVTRSLSLVFLCETLYPSLGGFFIGWLGFFGIFWGGKEGFFLWSWGILRAFCIPIWASWLWLLKTLWDLDNYALGWASLQRNCFHSKRERRQEQCVNSPGAPTFPMYSPSVFPQSRFIMVSLQQKRGFLVEKRRLNTQISHNCPCECWDQVCGWTGEAGIWDEHQSSC